MFRVFSILLWFVAAFFVAKLLPGAWSAREAGAEAIAKIAILLLFAWSLIEILIRARRVQGEHNSVAEFQSLYARAQQGDARPNSGDPRAVRRAEQMAECTRIDISRLHETVPAIASLDAATLAGSYGPLNVYAWVLPVLGFMGTALGMAKAIGGFKEALRNTTSNINELVQSLSSGVIPALSDAFHVTILALGAALVVYLCTSALRDWDQEALHKLDRLCILMLASIPLPESPGNARIVQAIERISKQIADIQGVPETLEKAGKAIAAASEQLQVAARELEASATASYTVTIQRNKPAQPSSRIDGAVRSL
jgi:biopolymer transport protein ExbB/TolQ